MAVPKKRTSKATKGQRRSHDALQAVTLTVCTNCSKPTLPHHACQHCGFYKGRQVAKV